jgi:hypothetical protein
LPNSLIEVSKIDLDYKILTADGQNQSQVTISERLGRGRSDGVTVSVPK